MALKQKGPPPLRVMARPSEAFLLPSPAGLRPDDSPRPHADGRDREPDDPADADPAGEPGRGGG
jgi:hypothetical protein